MLGFLLLAPDHANMRSLLREPRQGPWEVRKDMAA